ncbi:Cytochrome P450 [Neorhodopirellula lusitana]|uniref:Cytochrome P450 n=1 Tax=Neorhodopirellula lusitana TaxID=445327 RepID=A0ABY1QLM7_9BACT|nr:cytochrome P450 [Neorhodopirellula lusitana]SMP74915.1 Cytochrome P450 [Neorhodopirellula lusitana]
MNSAIQKKSPSSFTGDLVRPRLCYRQWMLAGNPAYFFDHLASQFGDFVHYRGLFSFYLVNHPALVKQVLMNTHKTFDKNTVIYDRFRNVFGDGLVVSEGAKWKRQRRMMQPMFGPVTVQGFFHEMVSAAEELADRWHTQCQTGTVFDIADDMERVTLQIAGKVLFSDGFEEAREQIAAWTSTINHYSAKPPLPIVRQIWFPSQINRQLKQTLSEFQQFTHQLIAERRGGPKVNDLLGILLQAKHEEDGMAMTDAEIAEEVLGMIIGGHETSSSALTWLWYELHHNPSVQECLLEEIDAVVGDGPVKLEHLPQLRYARMVIDECLRLHPPFWFENRNVMQDTNLGGHRIPKGSMVVFSRYSLHRHSSFWNAPETFDPLRQNPEHPENTRSSYAQVPFGGGPRICIGLNFAIMELTVMLVVIARRYRVIVDSSDRHEMAAQLTMTPRHGLKVRLESR